MITKTFKVYGSEGHRQRISFGESFTWDFSKGDDVRIIECECQDKTGTNEYVILKITRNTKQEVYEELDGQLCDGLFENSRYGRVEEIMEDE